MPENLKKYFLVALVLTICAITVVGCAAYKKPLEPITPKPPTQKTGNKPNYGPLRNKISVYMAKTGGEYSFLLKDLNSGGELDIGATKAIPGASTTKMPIAFYLYHLASVGKLNLNDKVIYVENQDFQTGAGALQYFAVDGWKYNYRTLGNLMITLSDNVAKNMLVRKLGVNNIAGYMTSLGGKTVYPGGQNITTARDMVTYFRAALVFQKNNPELGNLFLNDLNNTIWDNDGLPGKLPDNIKVAHKEGDILGIADDAGIVYLPGRPYILAVLTKNAGANPDEGFRIIADISRMVYDFQAGLPKASGQ